MKNNVIPDLANRLVRGRRIAKIGLIILVTVGLSWNLLARETELIQLEMSPGIVWYGVLKDGLEEANRTGKPILLLSAAPNCAGVSGLW